MKYIFGMTINPQNELESQRPRGAQCL